MTLNREQRRALSRAKPAAQKAPLTINPLFSLSTAARNELALQERKSLDALYEHRATIEDVRNIEAVIESSIRAITLTQREPRRDIDAEGLGHALNACYRAAWSLRHAQQRHERSGVYGLDAKDRQALMVLDDLVAEMRKPGVILRKTWMEALRETYHGSGVRIPKLEDIACL